VQRADRFGGSWHVQRRSLRKKRCRRRGITRTVTITAPVTVDGRRCRSDRTSRSARTTTPTIGSVIPALGRRPGTEPPSGAYPHPPLAAGRVLRHRRSAGDDGPALVRRPPARRPRLNSRPPAAAELRRSAEGNPGRHAAGRPAVGPRRGTEPSDWTRLSHRRPGHRTRCPVSRAARSASWQGAEAPARQPAETPDGADSSDADHPGGSRGRPAPRPPSAISSPRADRRTDHRPQRRRNADRGGSGDLRWHGDTRAREVLFAEPHQASGLGDRGGRHGSNRRRKAGPRNAEFVDAVTGRNG